MTLFKLTNNGKEQMTAQEETDFLAVQTKLTDIETAQKNAADAVATQKAIDKTTGNQKLLDLGLTQAEVDALTG